MFDAGVVAVVACVLRLMCLMRLMMLMSCVVVVCGLLLMCLMRLLLLLIVFAFGVYDDCGGVVVCFCCF